jgi:hypothetical protein
MRYRRLAYVDTTLADISIAEFRQQLKAHGFGYVLQTRGFLDLRRKRFKRLLGVRDDGGRLKYRETLTALIEARLT